MTASPKRLLNRISALRFLITTCLALCFIGRVVADEPGDRHQTRKIEGWTVHISKDLLRNEASSTKRAIQLLTSQLREIVRVVPKAAVEELRKVPLWFSPEYPGIQPRAEYHPDAGWLKNNNRNPAMAKAVEFTNIRIFEQETKRMPNFTLHELAHGYHDRVLPDGFGNVRIQAAFESAKEKKLYENVEQRFGDGRSAKVRAYAMSSPMEYFAESTEAYFTTNDFFPFTRDELEKHDPEMLALLKELWSDQTAQEDDDEPKDGSDEDSKATTSMLQDWKYSGSFWILTTTDGAEMPEGVTVEQFPLLIRLHRDVFDFSQAAANGDDIRFSLSTGESLAYQIDEWNAPEGRASLWVRIPEIKGNSRQQIRMHWGNPKARSESSGTAVFNASNGYLAVWHMNDEMRDETSIHSGKDTGTLPVEGLIGTARHFVEGKGFTAGEEITTLPTGANTHSTELWFRPERTNATLIGWGNEQGQGKVVMQFRSPPHLRMDCYFSGGNVDGTAPVPMADWSQVVHTYREGEAHLYLNGALDESNISRGSPLNIRTPARLFLGGWYHNYDYVGDLDEVRISSVVRSPEWIRLQYENQKTSQSLVGVLQQTGNQFSVSQTELVMSEAQSVTLEAKAGGAQKVVWIEKRGELESIVATNRLQHTFHAGRVTSNETASNDNASNSGTKAIVVFKAIYPDTVKTQEVAITIRDDIPEPRFTLAGPQNWDGRQTIEIVPEISNREAMKAQGAESLKIEWTVDDVAVLKRVEGEKLILTRAQGSGSMRVTASIANGGTPVVQTLQINVKEPESQDDWIPRTVSDNEQPEDNQFIARDNPGRSAPSFGSLVYAGTLSEAADSVFVRTYADEQLFATETATVGTDRKYSIVVKLTPGLIHYRTEFGSKKGDKETVLHSAKNIVCGDAYLICGQSNAVATDFGKDNPLQPSEWVRTFGATAGDPNNSRLTLWANAEARSPGGKSEVGYWGLELGRRLVDSEQIPIFIINGAVGGTRIDQHQRNDDDPTDVHSIYGRLLWRVQQAKLTHGIRAVLWHQGENDQGADGPTGGYGYETYRPYFVDLAASWKRDYPNVQHYYMFQIWPRSCAMGINGSDNRLREVQRTMPRLFSNLSVIPTLGVKPPGGCHFPAAGYAEFARLLHPMIRYHLYHRYVDPFDPPDLQRAWFTSDRRDELVLDFGQNIQWSDSLFSQFHLDGLPRQVVSGSASGSRITLKLKGPTQSGKITYLDSENWNPDNILLGQNGLAALTFCDVPIELGETRTAPKERP